MKYTIIALLLIGLASCKDNYNTSYEVKSIETNESYILKGNKLTSTGNFNVGDTVLYLEHKVIITKEF